MVADLEIGTFVFLNLIAIGTFVVALFPREKFVFSAVMILSMVMFSIVALFMVGEYDIVSVKTISDGIKTWTEREMIISDANTGGVSWAYMGMSTLCLVLFILRWKKD